jgi:hypothetical protein
MALRVSIFMGVLLLDLFAQATAVAQTPDERVPQTPGLRPNSAMILLDYQSLTVTGDKPIDLMGFHVHHKVTDWLYVGAGLSAPLFKGSYGGFTAFDVGAHAQQRLTGSLFATAGLAVGAGAGGRSVEKAKALSGSGGFFKGYAGLGYDFGNFAIGANVARMKFSQSPIGGTQADVFLEIPYTYLTGPFSSHGQRISPADARRASEDSGETMWMVILDNYGQRNPEGTYKGSFNILDLQYAHYFAQDIYWFADLGVGYRGLPLSNQVLGGVGQRVQLSQRFTVYGQLGLGSGIYAPEVIHTDSGLLVYPKVSAEYALSQDLGLAASAGYLVAPKGSSKNWALGLGLTYHIRAGEAPSLAGQNGWPRYQAYRVSLLQQVDASVRYREIRRDRLQMIGIQVDAIVNDRWYIPLQGAIAYSTYLDHPGYGELLAGIGLHSRTTPDERWQLFGQLMAGTNVHGLAMKAGGGLRYSLDDRMALQVAAGRIEARNSSGARFTANSVALGLDYRFSTPAW